jgi:DNA-directed RNA polymerase subunit RPC12/RpoP
MSTTTTATSFASAADHIKGKWRWKLTTGEGEDWYRCVNCGDLMLDQRSNIHVALNCPTCGNGHESLLKVDPVEEAKARNEAIDRVTFR